MTETQRKLAQQRAKKLTPEGLAYCDNLYRNFEKFMAGEGFEWQEDLFFSRYNDEAYRFYRALMVYLMDVNQLAKKTMADYLGFSHPTINKLLRYYDDKPVGKPDKKYFFLRRKYQDLCGVLQHFKVRKDLNYWEEYHKEKIAFHQGELDRIKMMKNESLLSFDNQGEIKYQPPEYQIDEVHKLTPQQKDRFLNDQ